MAKYITGTRLKKTNYSIKFTGKSEDFINQIRENTNHSGYFNFEIKERKQPSEKGETHYIQVDEWKPNK